MTKRIRSQKELIEKRLAAQFFLQNEPIHCFYTVIDIAKKFDLSEYFVLENLMSFFPSTTQEEYYDANNNILYCSRIKIAEILGINQTFLCKLFKHDKITPIKIRFLGKGGRLTPKNYYNIDNDIKYLPKEYQRIYSFHQIKNLPAEIYHSIPKNFQEKEFFTFCCLILYKIQNDIWANLSQLQLTLKKSFNIYYSISRISSALSKFEKYNYLKKIRSPKSINTIYQIIKGPFFLTHGKKMCIDIFTQKTYTMYAPFDFFKGKV